MGHVRSKRSPGQIALKPCSSSRGHRFASIFMKLYQNICPGDISISSNMDYVGLKTRSLDQIALKPCSSSRGHSFASIFMKLNQNDSLDKISVKF